MLEKHSDNVKYVVKHFPLSGHQFAHKAAMGALSSNNQGKFWEFHEKLLKNFEDLNDEKIKGIAQELDLDMERFDRDMQSEDNRRIIKEDIENGDRIGVDGTPSVFLNGKRIKNRDLSQLPVIIERVLGDP